MGVFTIAVEALSREAFSPFGDVISRLAEPGRRFPAANLQNLRPGAAPTLGVSRIPPSAEPIIVRRVERHLHSSQTFLPLGEARFISVVAAASAQVPDRNRFRAFLAQPGQGVSYAPGTWHHPLVVIGRPADFATLMWRAGDDADEEFADLRAPFGFARLLEDYGHSPPDR